MGPSRFASERDLIAADEIATTGRNDPWTSLDLMNFAEDEPTAAGDVLRSP
jgi:hypothetical protein